MVTIIGFQTHSQFLLCCPSWHPISLLHAAGRTQSAMLWDSQKKSYSNPHKDKCLWARLVSNHKKMLWRCYYIIFLLQGSLKSMKSSFYYFWCILYFISRNTFHINHISLTFKFSYVRVYLLPWMFFFPVSFIPSSESLSLLSHCDTATCPSNIFFWGRHKISFSIFSSFETLVLSKAVKDTNLGYSLFTPLSNSFCYFHNTIYSFIKCLLYLIQRRCHDDIRDR